MGWQQKWCGDGGNGSNGAGGNDGDVVESKAVAMSKIVCWCSQSRGSRGASGGDGVDGGDAKYFSLGLFSIYFKKK